MNCEKFQWLKHQLVASKHSLRADFEACFKGTGPEKHQMESSDLTDYCNLQHGLIKEVAKLHQSEMSPRNADLLKLHRSAITVLNLAKDGGRGGGIYCLNDPSAVTYVIGDLHGDDATLDKILHVTRFFEAVYEKDSIKLVFLGDYVDRGKAQLRTMVKILALKVLYPKQVILLRGNHDGGKLCSDGSVLLAYRKESQLEDTDYFPLYLQHLSRVNPTFDPALCGAYLSLFDEFAYIALILQGSEIGMAVHGGIPRPLNESFNCYPHLDSLFQLTNPSVVDCQERSILHNLMWSDPYRGAGNPTTSTGRFSFSQMQFNAFRDRFSITHLIRGHQRVESGYRSLFDGYCHTVFSTGDQHVMDSGNEVSAYSGVAPKVLRMSVDGKIAVVRI